MRSRIFVSIVIFIISAFFFPDTLKNFYAYSNNLNSKKSIDLIISVKGVASGMEIDFIDSTTAVIHNSIHYEILNVYKSSDYFSYVTTGFSEADYRAEIIVDSNSDKRKSSCVYSTYLSSNSNDSITMKTRLISRKGAEVFFVQKTTKVNISKILNNQLPFAYIQAIQHLARESIDEIKKKIK